VAFFSRLILYAIARVYSRLTQSARVMGEMMCRCRRYDGKDCYEHDEETHSGSPGSVWPVWGLQLPIDLPFMYNIKMNDSKTINVKHKKRGRPATGKTPIIGVRIEPDIIEAVEQYRLGKDPEINQSEAIRRILREWLAKNGYLKDPT